MSMRKIWTDAEECKFIYAIFLKVLDIFSLPVSGCLIREKVYKGDLLTLWIR